MVVQRRREIRYGRQEREATGSLIRVGEVRMGCRPGEDVDSDTIPEEGMLSTPQNLPRPGACRLAPSETEFVTGLAGTGRSNLAKAGRHVQYVYTHGPFRPSVSRSLASV
ncbi:hypothetical protein MTO96_012967 [Rhipicephalus appendiculatus]